MVICVFLAGLVRRTICTCRVLFLNPEFFLGFRQIVDEVGFASSPYYVPRKMLRQSAASETLRFAGKTVPRH